MGTTGKRQELAPRAGNSVLKIILRYLPKRASLLAQYYRYHRRWPNLKSPSTFSEKIQYRKLYDRDPRLASCSDKLLVKDFVARTIGHEFVTPTLWSGRELPKLEDRNWPLPFFVKSNHGSGGNIFVRSEGDLDWPSIERQTRRWAKQRYRPHLREDHYNKIDPCILVEPFIGTGAVPTDYKFFIFNGRAAFSLIYTDRASDLRVQMLDRDWRPLECRYYRDPPDSLPQKPACYDEMLAAAERLGREFSFVRVDFYEIDGRPRFGELTFTPGSGFRPYEGEGYDLQFGRLWNIADMRPSVRPAVPFAGPIARAVRLFGS